MNLVIDISEFREIKEGKLEKSFDSCFRHKGTRNEKKPKDRDEKKTEW